MTIFKLYGGFRIPRPEPNRQIEASFQIHPVTALLGPRQCGKTTLALLIAEQAPSTFFDMENPVDIQRLSAPMQALKVLSCLVIIDEVQRKPELFELLRVLVDRSGQDTRFLLLGSASPQLVKGVSESLAGRIGFVDLGGFQLWEIGASWEGFALEHVISTFQTRDAYFWATHAGAELDLMVSISGKRHGIEFKYTDAPGRKRSMHVAIEDLGLEHLWVIYPGNQEYALDDRITALSLGKLAQLKKTVVMR